MTISGKLGFYLGSTFVTHYGLCITCGILAAGLLGMLLIHRNGLDAELALAAAGICGAGALIGAKLLYLVVTLPQLTPSQLSQPSTWESLIQGGFVFYGGLLGALAIAPFAGMLLKIDITHYLEALSPCIPLGHAFGRFGCLLVGCCYGCPTTGSFSVTYLHSPIAPNEIALFPMQLIEAVCCLAICLILVTTMYGKEKAHSLELYCGLYAICRFVLEFWRYDAVERGMLGVFSTSQWISLGMFAVVALLWSKRNTRARQAAPNVLRP